MGSVWVNLLCFYSLFQSNLLAAALLSYFSSILPTKERQLLKYAGILFLKICYQVKA